MDALIKANFAWTAFGYRQRAMHAAAAGKNGRRLPWSRRPAEPWSGTAPGTPSRDGGQCDEQAAPGALARGQSFSARKAVVPVR